jgi:hypothetical protein
MKNAALSSSIMIRFEHFLVRWNGIITALVTLCAITAIVFGIVWMFLRKDTLLFIVLGLSSCYLIGKNFWGFRDKRFDLNNL